MKKVLLFSLLIAIVACVPKEQVVLKDIKNIEIKTGLTGEPVLKGEAIFNNPNKIKMTLKEINIEVFMDGKKAAHSDQKMETKVPAKSDFSIPLEVKVNLQEIGLLNTLFGFLSGKSHEVRFVGFVRVKVHGVLVKIPVDHKSDLKLKI